MTNNLLPLDRAAQDLQTQTEATDPEFTAEVPEAKEGDTVVFLASGLVYQTATGTRLTAEVSRAGEVYNLTRADIQNVDRDGKNFWNLLHDEKGQIDRWGAVRFQISDPATDTPIDWRDPRWVPENEAHRDEARHAARALAMTLPEPERTERLRAITSQFGRVATSGTLTTYRSGDDDGR